MLRLKTKINDQALLQEIEMINEIIREEFNWNKKIKEIQVELDRGLDVNVLGMYHAKSETIYLNSPININTLYHEVAHSIDFEVFEHIRFAKFKLTFSMIKLSIISDEQISLKKIYAIMIVNLRTMHMSSFVYSNFRNNSTLHWNYKINSHLQRMGSYWCTPEEVFARTMEVWFYIKIRNKKSSANHQPTFFSIFANNIIQVSQECEQYIDGYISNVRNY